jgi:hypothetical protein
MGSFAAAACVLPIWSSSVRSDSSLKQSKGKLTKMLMR